MRNPSSLFRAHRLPKRLLLLATCGVALQNLAGADANPFLAGADMSHLQFFEDRGVVYRTNDTPRDALEMLAESGLNCVRLRLFTSSSEQAAADPYNFTNNLDYTLPLAKRVNTAGLKLLLDLHYSDTWADPGHQDKPDAWKDLSFSQLRQRLHDYSSNTIATLKAEGAMPEFVQVGNEIIGGMLWNDGRVGGSFENNVQWRQLGDLMKAAIAGINAAAGETPPRIIIHIDRGGDWGATRWFFDKLNQQRVPYHIIGQSYYPWWHGDLEDLRTCLNNTVNRYGKPVIIAETAYPWTNSVWDPDTGVDIPTTPQGQVAFVTELSRILKSLPNGKGMGIIWWGSEYVKLEGQGLAGFDRRSFFDYQGNVLPVVRALGQLTAPVKLKARLEGAQLRLEWPLSGAGLSLTSTTSPAPASLWISVTNEVESAVGTFRVSLPLIGLNAFYRLQSQGSF